MDFSDAEMKLRLSKVRELMAAEEVDALYLTGEHNVRYVSGFKGEPRHLWITQSEIVLYTGFRTEPWARAQTADIEISTDADLLADVARRLESEGIRTIGVERSITHSGFERIQEKFSTYDVKLSAVVETARMVKSETEISYMRTAQKMAEQVLTDTLPDIRPGVTERFVRGQIRSRIAETEEADDYAFGPLVIFGENAWEVHHRPDFRKAEEGDLIIIDMGVRYRGYNSDMTRTLCMGTPTDEMRHVYATVDQAMDKALDAIHAGQQNHAADVAARDHIESAGYGKFFTHGLGHSIGLEVHDPLLGFGKATSETTLESGMVMTVEPGIYLEGQFGVRIEDTVVVTDNGYENLMSFERELIML
ncbi:MAG: Xaa-Pro peptidase family protein [Planctomycetota bacterium]|nr:Xaa-Pro peptidase family protein [Planctomycetota bacterium]